MATNYTSPDKTASIAFRPNGVYTGLVTRVDTNLKRVWVMIPRVSNGFQFGPLSVATTILPTVGDRVACMFVENRSDDVIILGTVKASTSPTYVPLITCTSSTRPVDAEVGTQIYEIDTAKTLLWNGTEWTGLNIDTLLVDNNTLYIDPVNNRVGVNTGAPSVALDVTGAISATGAITAGGAVSAGGSISGTSLYVSGSVSAASVAAVGGISGASVTAVGSISGESLTTTGAANVGSLTSTGAAQATRLTLTQATGTAPIIVSSTTVVSNLNADLLDGQEGTYYQNASNLNAGTLSSARLPAFSGDATSTAGTSSLTLATVNSNTGSFGNNVTIPSVTVNAKGLVTAVSTNTVRSATTGQSGIVQLSDSVASTSTTEAATANAAKAAYDIGAAALARSGGTMSGVIDMNGNVIRLRFNDNNHRLFYNGGIDGPELSGWARVRVVGFNGGAKIFDFKDNGNAQAPGSWVDNSSIRFKTNVVDLPSMSTVVDALRPITYTYKKSEDDSRHLGFIAEEVAEVIPEAVEYDEAGDPIGLAYGRLVVVAIAEIQALRRRVAALEERCTG